MKKLLVTGASGFLGWHICHATKKEWQTYGTTRTHNTSTAEVRLLKIDLTDFRKLRKLFQSIKPDAVIHTAAMSDPNTCENYRNESRKINVDSSIDIAALCADSSIPCIFTSSDLVFDGLHPPYRETDQVCPVCLYGEQKALAENGMLHCYPKVTICRLPLLFGITATESTSFIQPIINAMKAGRELRLFVDEFRTPVSVQTAVHGIMVSLEKVTGLIHLGGIERISRYNFGRMLMEILNLRDARITPCRQNDVTMPASRPPDVSLDSSKALALGYKPVPLREEIQKLKGKT